MKRCPVIASFRNGTQHHLSYFSFQSSLRGWNPRLTCKLLFSLRDTECRFKENETPGILNFDINYNYFQYSLTKTVPILYLQFQHLIGTKQNVPTKYSSSIVAGYNSKSKNPS